MSHGTEMITRVAIEYGAIPNGNQRACDFLPMIWDNGKPMGNTWAVHGFDESDALRLAEAAANRHAEKHIGDWDITVTKRGDK